MAGGRFWTTGEVRLLQTRRRQRVPLRLIADELGRTLDAVNAFLRYKPATATTRKRERKPLRPKKRHIQFGPPSPPPSWRLARSIRHAIARFANDNALTEQEARAILLGREPCGSVIRGNFQRADRTGHTPFEIVSGRFQPKTQAKLNAVKTQSEKA